MSSFYIKLKGGLTYITLKNIILGDLPIEFCPNLSLEEFKF
jgi:hypothetical protein